MPEDKTPVDAPQDAPSAEDMQTQLDQMRAQMDALSAENTKLSASLEKRSREESSKFGKLGKELQVRDQQIRDLQSQLIGQINSKLQPSPKEELPSYRIGDPIKDENFSGDLSRILAEREIALRREMEQRFEAQQQAYHREVEKLKSDFDGELRKTQLVSRVEREKEALKNKGFSPDEIEEALQFGIEHNMPSLRSAAFEMFGEERFAKSTPEPIVPRSSGVVSPQKIAQEVARQKPKPEQRGGAQRQEVSTALEDKVNEWRGIFERGEAGKLTPEQFADYKRAVEDYSAQNGSATAYYR